MLKSLFKPKWQSKKPSVRLKALDNLTGSCEEIITLATSDPDSDVRLYAVKILDHIPTVAMIASKADGVIPRAAKKRLTELALSHPIDDKALAKAYRLIEDEHVHPKVLCDTQKSIDVRRQAICHVDDQELLYELAKTENSKEIQFLAAQQLVDYQQLKKLEKLTNNNKKLRKLLKEKSQKHQEQEAHRRQLEGLCNNLDELTNTDDTNNWKQAKTRFLTIQQMWKSFDSSPPRDIQQRYETLTSKARNHFSIHQSKEQALEPLRNQFKAITQTLENCSQMLEQELTQTFQTEVTETLLASKTDWQSIKNEFPEDEQASLEHSYRIAYQHIEDKLSRAKSSQKAIRRYTNLHKKADKILSHKHTVQAKQINELQQQWDKLKTPVGMDISQLTSEYKNKLNQLKAQLKKQQLESETHIKKATQALEEMEALIQSDQLSKAINSYQTVNSLLRNMGNLPSSQLAAIKRRFHTATPIIQSAKSWRHWGTDKAREQLISQVQVLCDNTSISPLERADQIKCLRSEWQKLGKMDPSHHQKLWETFDQNCSLAYEPCQQHFKEESTLRASNMKQRQQLCEQLEALEKETDWKSVNWKEISRVINKLRVQWKKSGAVDRNQWKHINGQFNNAMDAIEVHLANERRINWTQRESLVQQAESLVSELEASDETEALLPTLITSAKELQSQWQPTVTSTRSNEQKIWKQFHDTVSRIFDYQRQKNTANRTELENNLKTKQAILKALENILQCDDSDFPSANQQAKALQEQFTAITQLSNKTKAKQIAEKFEQTKNLLAERLKQINTRQRIKQLLLLAKKAKLCDQKELEEPNQAIWETFSPLNDNKLEEQIQQRFSSEKLSIKQQKQNTEQLHTLVLEIEVLLELPTPDNYQKHRMEYQVARLSEQMLGSSQNKQTNQEIALQKIQDWYLIGMIANADRQILTTRFSQVSKWMKNI